MKTILNAALFFIFSTMIFSLQGCSNTGVAMDPGTMRIWLAPSHRSDTNVDTNGNIYIRVQ